MTYRDRFIDWCRAQLGKPVLMGAKSLDAMDCSGLVTLGLRHVGGPDWTKTHDCDRLWRELDPVVGEPYPGDLVFWWAPGADAPKRGDLEHVAVLVDGGLVVTADGATHKITTVEAALAAHAIVRVRGNINYRPRYAGARRFPLIESPDGRVVLGCFPDPT